MRTGTSPLAWVLPLALLAGCIPSRSGMGVVPPSRGRAAAPAAGPRLAGIPTQPRRASAPPVLASPPPTTSSPDWPAGSAAPASEPTVTVSTTTALPSPAEHAERATRYARMGGDECERALRERSIPYVTVAPGEAPGVDRPVRLTGPLHGVEIHEPGPRASWHRSVNEILDCRLALALDDVAELLSEQGFVEVVHVSFYRRGARIARRGVPSQHAAGRAFDLSVLVHRDGSRFDVQNDWGGAIGDRSCGPDATPARHPSAGARALRAFACEAGARGLVHIVLTPNFNADHRNHLHLDIEPRRESATVH